MMGRKWGDFPIQDIRRGTLQEFKMRSGAISRGVSQIVAVSRVLLKLAVDQKHFRTNPTPEPSVLPAPARVPIWTRHDDDKFLSVGPPSTRMAFLLKLSAALWPSDVLAVSRNRVSEKRDSLWVVLGQQKTVQPLDVSSHSQLGSPLRERQRDKIVSRSPKKSCPAIYFVCRKTVLIDSTSGARELVVLQWGKPDV